MREKTLADRFRWVWKFTGRSESLQVRLTGTSVIALIRRSKILVIETTGRRTGKRHRTPVMYWVDGDKVLIGGGAAGMTRVDWVANVRRNPDAVAWIKRQPRSVLVRELRGDDYDRARRQALKRWPEAVRYERSGRKIPFFSLEERSLP
ncbi:MAG: nitroreductase/quinone reductase family protein [Actinomycetota bacterium]